MHRNPNLALVVHKFVYLPVHKLRLFLPAGRISEIVAEIASVKIVLVILSEELFRRIRLTGYNRLIG